MQCLLHLTELSFCHLFKKLDGGSSGPSDFKGIIGKQLEQSNTLPIVKFEKNYSELPVTNVEMSTDQQYLYDMVKSVSSGIYDESLANKKSGNLSHARWGDFCEPCFKNVCWHRGAISIYI